MSQEFELFSHFTIMNSLLVLLFGVSSILLANAQQWAMPIQPRNQQFQFFQSMGNCYDTAVNCLENSYFCNQPYYENIMRQQCARTCQFCREDTPDFDSTTCRDVNPECRIWSQRGFCDSLFYPEHVKRRYCALSCGYCRPSMEEEPHQRRPSIEEEPHQRRPSMEEEPHQRRPSMEEEPRQRRPLMEEEPRQQRPTMEEEPRPREPFADQPTPKFHDHTHVVRKTTPSGVDKDEEFASTTTTSEPILSNEEEKSEEKKDSKKKKTDE